MLHELDSHKDNVFVTLTYDDCHLPENGSLRKDHLQKFFKRLRRDLPVDYKIKYFACGEYGDKTDRPHYHSIIFGLGLWEFDKNLIIQNWPYCDWSNKAIKRNSFGLAEADSIRYVAQYIDKKFTGDLAIEQYDNRNREPVFKLASNGIGKEYCLRNSEQIIRQQEIKMFGVSHRVPRYYLQQLGVDFKEYKHHAEELDLNAVEKYTGERLSSEEFYRTKSIGQILELEDKKKRARTQRRRNLEAKMSLKRPKL